MAVMATSVSVASGTAQLLSDATQAGAVATSAVAHRRHTIPLTSPCEDIEPRVDEPAQPPLTVAGVAWAASAFSRTAAAIRATFGASIGRLFPALMLIMRQRLVLACDALDLSDFALPAEVENSQPRVGRVVLAEQTSPPSKSTGPKHAQNTAKEETAFQWSKEGADLTEHGKQAAVLPVGLGIEHTVQEEYGKQAVPLGAGAASGWTRRPAAQHGNQRSVGPHL